MTELGWWLLVEFARRLKNQQSKSGDPRGLILDKSHSSTVRWTAKKRRRKREKADLMAPRRHDGDQDEGA